MTLQNQPHVSIFVSTINQNQMQDKVNLNISVVGGGKSGQVGAIVHGLTRALSNIRMIYYRLLKRGFRYKR